MADLSNSKYVGTWKGVSITLLGRTEPLEVENILTLKEDGTAIYITPENNDIRAYIWKETSYGVFLDGKSDLKLTDEEGMLKTKLFGFVTLNFVKEEK